MFFLPFLFLSYLFERHSDREGEKMEEREKESEREKEEVGGREIFYMLSHATECPPVHSGSHLT